MSWWRLQTSGIVGLMSVILVTGAAPLPGYGQAADPPAREAGSLVSRQAFSLDPETTIRKAPLSPNEVDPREMYSAFLTQYELGPDPRWGQALQALIQMNMRWNQQAVPSYSLGEMTFDDKTASVPLLKEGRVILTLEFPTYADFPEGLAMLTKAVGAMGWQYTGVKAESRGDDLEARLITWRDRFYSMDPRGIIRALINLEEVRGASAANAVNAKLWATASVGYAMLGFSLDYDVTDYVDTCYAYALACLAISQQFDPTLPTVRERSFLAMRLGYKAHARALLEKQTFAADDHFSAIITAYLLGDVAGLSKLHEKYPVPLSYCLLGRLYREFGLHKEAGVLAERFLRAEPRSYASMIATINDGDLTLGHALTVAYPLDILTRMKKNVASDMDQEGWGAWMELARAIHGEESDSDFSLQQFDQLLEQWLPWGSDIHSGLIIDTARIKDIYRTLYIDALYARFTFLMDRWNVTEKALAFVRSLEKTDRNHPVVLKMRMQVADEVQDRAGSDRLCVRIIQSPNTTAGMAVDALHGLSSYLDKVKYAPVVFSKLTGKFGHILSAGEVLTYIYHYDMAEKMFAMSVERDPFNMGGYEWLAYVRGDPDVIEEAAQKYSYNYKVVRSAGSYFGGKKDPRLLEKALDYYEQAMAIVPSELSLSLSKARVLRRLKRNAEAIAILKEWLDQHAGNDMTTLAFKTELAENYLDLDDPKAALAVLTPEVIASYQGSVMVTAAWAYDALGDDAKAEDLFQKVVERYPAADGSLYDRIQYLWRHQRDQEAVALIAKARPRHGQMDYFWYFGTVRKELAHQPKERILKIVDALLASGAHGYEISGLALQCFKPEPSLAYDILSRIPITEPMGFLVRISSLYKVLKDWQGEAAADQFVDQNVPPPAIGPLTGVLYNDGLYELLVRKLQNADSFPPPHREFLWLEKVLAWEALGRKPAELSAEIDRHYKIPSSDYYNTLARFLLGQVKLPDLLGEIVTAKQRCEFAYYIGFSKRMAGQYAEAASWYLICLGTQLTNNGEMHWSMEELTWWTHAGTRHRNKLVRDDEADFWARKMAEEQFN